MRRLDEIEAEFNSPVLINDEKVTTTVSLQELLREVIENTGDSHL